MGIMKDTHEGSEIRQRAEKELAIEVVSTELLSEMTLEKTPRSSSTSFKFIRLSWKCRMMNF